MSIDQDRSNRQLVASIASAAALLFSVLVPSIACAQSASNLFVTQSDGGNSSTYYWGTVSPGVPGASSSATMHVSNGTAAAQVNASKKGILLPQNISIYAIGVQNVVSSTIVGSNNTVTQNPSQSGTNSGDVTNTGTINVR